MLSYFQKAHETASFLSKLLIYWAASLKNDIFILPLLLLKPYKTNIFLYYDIF